MKRDEKKSNNTIVLNYCHDKIQNKKKVWAIQPQEMRQRIVEAEEN